MTTSAETTSDPPDSSSEDTLDAAFEKHGCCHWLSPGACWWERITHAAPEKPEETTWWAKGIKGLKKVREWSELVAGPKWKTFIRRFGKNQNRNGKFQYDPMSYSLNFDEGIGRNDDFSESFRDFSSRYAMIPVFTKGSLDLGRDGPLFA